MKSGHSNTDLHMHSTASDGGYRPEALLKKCKEVGLEYIALTDHDTTAGVKEAVETGKQLGITVIPGIEFSTKYNGKSVHILGYGLDYDNEELCEMLKGQQEMRRKRLDVIIRKLKDVGLIVTAEDVLEFVDGGSIGRPHVAKALIKRGYVKDVAEAFDRFLAEGRPCYVPKEKEMTPEEALNWIKRMNGVSILAHPVYYDLDDWIETLVADYGLDGVEVYHRDHSPEDRNRYEHLIQQIEEKYKLSLLRTGGSDFHHEDYGRVPEPLGITRIDNYFAEQLLTKIHKMRR
ncbi:PHP domain-containing protein [Alkalihalobacterium chitinilyticum]|uniref:PHP domain-containing protein n=1 Tax=Alkalihalobacterium chitinilyticum TaxID=2980103 RepID=A0ABT5VBK4_9BACI|nr:PHP domain-containing protein [Alkalihalobacterium chitinilyticum]MDE5412820.1 PHP domain-containing protein [Alkalihalobacterium chitinilyticum]